MIWRDRISIDPGICHGKPCVKGTRILVSTILEMLANGDTVEEVLKAYPGLAREDIVASIHFAKSLSDDPGAA